MDERWRRFKDQRGDHLKALGAVVLESVVRRDTRWPAFHGCYDWHSAVHGVYALHALYRWTGDESYIDTANALLTPDALDRELALVKGGALDHERPYGDAWLLRLTMERERVAQTTDLRPLADTLAGRLASWITGLSDDDLLDALMADNYRNLSWPLLNLWQYATWRGDAERADTMMALTQRLPSYDEHLPLERDVARTRDFFPPALHRALAIATILPDEQVATWTAAFLPKHLDLKPIAQPQSPHQAGLNFSRAWGLWALWTSTADPTWRTLFLDHVEAHIAQPDHWAKDYAAHSHWIPQFGIYAIGMTMESSVHETQVAS